MFCVRLCRIVLCFAVYVLLVWLICVFIIHLFHVLLFLFGVFFSRSFRKTGLMCALYRFLLPHLFPFLFSFLSLIFFLYLFLSTRAFLPMQSHSQHSYCMTPPYRLCAVLTHFWDDFLAEWIWLSSLAWTALAVVRFGREESVLRIVRVFIFVLNQLFELSQHINWFAIYLYKFQQQKTR